MSKIDRRNQRLLGDYIEPASSAKNSNLLYSADDFVNSEQRKAEKERRRLNRREARQVQKMMEDNPTFGMF